MNRQTPSVYRQWLDRQRSLDERPELADRVMQSLASGTSAPAPRPLLHHSSRPRPRPAARLIAHCRRAAESPAGRSALITAASLVCALRLASLASMFIVW